MTPPPVASPRTLGRVFGTDWSIANVATLLRSNAARGKWSRSATPGGTRAKVNENYCRKVSALHLPTSVSVIFMHLDGEGGMYASICFTAADQYLPWNAEVAELWLGALFGEQKGRLLQEDAHPSVRQFTLPPTARL